MAGQSIHEGEGWVLVLPVKGGAGAKSRLGLGPELAAAIAADCLDAVLAAPSVRRVVVVAGDDEVARSAGAAGAEVVRQPTDQPGLGSAIRSGLQVAAGDAGPGHVAVLLADLPSLRPQDVEVALDHLAAELMARPGALFVPDLEGTGTVLLAGRRVDDLEPRFGPASAAAHEGTGARRACLDVPRLRRDVDTAQDLSHAVQLGVGRRTTRTLADMQATVLRYDVQNQTGEVVTDDGLTLPLAPGATARSGLRHLRPGQRISCEPVTGPDGAPVAVDDAALRGISD